MDALNYLPYELWIKVLQHVSLKDRICHIQYVSKSFHRLCNDVMILRRLNFEDYIFMPESICLSVIKRAKMYVRYLSFRNCTWFSSSMFANLPKLSHIASLDLLGCKLSGATIYTLLQRARSIQNLALTMTETDVQAFCGHSPRPTLEVKVLHIEFLINEEQSRPIIHVASALHLEDFIVSCCRNRPCSLSVVTHEECVHADGYLGFRTLLQSVDIAVNTEFSHIEFKQSNTPKRAITDLLRNAYLHCLGSNTDASEKLRHISLPFPIAPLDECVACCYCTGAGYPSSLPVLRYLSLSPDFLEADFCCYTRTSEGILMSCDLPKLSYLDLGRHTIHEFTIPMALYDRLSNFLNLVELNLKGLSFHLFMLLDAIKHLQHLTGLALRINETVKERLQSDDNTNSASSSRVSRVVDKNTSFFIELVNHFPNLEKLELTYCYTFEEAISANVLRPIGSLKKLEILKLRRFNLTDTVYLGKIFSECTNLTSLTVTNIGTTGHCEYFKFSKFLSDMPYLTHLDIGHPHLDSPSVFTDLCSIVNLQRLVIRFDVHLPANSLERTLCSLFSKCQQLCMCIIISNDVSEFVKKVISRVKRGLKTMQRHVVISYGSESYNLDPEAKSFVCRTRSSVATCNPHDLILKQ